MGAGKSRRSRTAAAFAVAAALVLITTSAFADQRSGFRALPLFQHHVANPNAVSCDLTISVECQNGNCSSVTSNSGRTACTGEYYAGFFADTEATDVSMSAPTNSLGLTTCIDSTMFPEIGIPLAFCWGQASLAPGASFTSSAKLTGSAPVLGFTEVVDPADPEAEPAIVFAYSNSVQPTCKPDISAYPFADAGKQYKVAWTATSAGTTYRLDESTSSDFSTNLVTQNIQGQEAVFTHSEPVSRRYYYRVQSLTCNAGGPGPFSDTQTVSVTYTPPPTTVHSTYDAVAPHGSTAPVSIEIFVPGVSGKAGTLDNPTFTATSDKPYMTVTPTTGTIPPAGTTITAVVNPTGLPPGANTGTVTVTPSTGPVQPTPVSLSLVTPVSPGGKTLPPPNALIIPVVTHVVGAAGPFVSDIRLTNAANIPVKYQITFTPRETDGTKTGKITTLTVNSLQTIALNDIVKDFFGYGATSEPGDTGFGALEIRPLNSSTTATYASSRTYVTVGSGTYGQFIAAIPFAQFATAMASVPLPGSPAVPSAAPMSLQQIAESPKFYTNLGLVEGSGTPATFHINVYDDNGTLLKSLPYSLQPGEQKQLGHFIAQTAGIPNLEDGRIEIVLDSATGAISAYASVLDGKTADPLAVTPVQPSLIKATRFVLPGVAEFVSPLSNFHSDIRIYNGGTTSATVTLTYYPQGNGTPVAVPPIVIGAGQVKAYDNVLPTLFKVTSGGGSVVTTTPVATSLVVSGRTYSVDANAGTYGQFIPGVTPSSGSIGTGDAPLQILQLEQSSRFRSNVGLVETTGNPAHVKLTLSRPDSNVSAVIERDLAANEFVQLGNIIQVAGFFNVAEAVYNARVAVEVTSGSGRVAAYGSIIDNVTSDPTYVPAQ